ncbi:transglutaminase-like domain-containing protein [Pseudoroseicyclus tamaricis]|uniref:Transglutaminase family protein n=1 Tax=Pseudoroseicyclus tamaricis TaxID=2705421 RepID=A0A6B2JQM4_9RHOB|nr:transglutaminase family protein [Pseudoroseicyclus tamaricis]NDV00438.1 transglutaminase family protein [Pseudoroseicyclus tamaricis]
MRLSIGCRLTYQLAQPTPMIAMLSVHYSRAADLERPDHLITTPSVPMHAYRDIFGNWCNRFVAPAGELVLSTDAVIRDAGRTDPYAPGAPQLAVEALPDEVLGFLLGSRYCDTDVLSDEAWQRFGQTEPGWARVQAICDFVHNHIRFGYEHARSTRTASEGLAEGQGVCRDYTHLAIAFCRCMNIPARYCTGYLGDVGVPLPHAPGDFAAWMEVYLGGDWWVFDPRNNVPRQSRVLIARGRDAADVPLTHSFGSADLQGFEVWTDELR